MGIYLNPGNRSFRDSLNSDVYVDKSEMVAELNRSFRTEQKYVCVSRARRFGKTMMTNLLSAYYSKGCDSRALFEGLKLARKPGWDAHLNAVNVIKFDMNAELCDATVKADVVKNLQASVVGELREVFPGAGVEPGDSIARSIAKIYNETGETFVFLVDEYDILIREDSAPQSLRDEYIAMLNALFKGGLAGSAISLAYITGILPIIRERVQSKLNNFTEYTMLAPKRLASYVGFTEDEVRGLCGRFGMDYEACRRSYDGYGFPGADHIFNPNSVVKAMRNGDYANYWVQTSALDAITFYLDANLDGLQTDILTMLEGGEVDVDTHGYDNSVSRFKNKNHVFTYLIHLGYLAYDSASGRCRIPNGEIREAWFSIMDESNDFGTVKAMIDASRDLLRSTEHGDANAVAAALDRAHSEISSSLTYNRESTLQSAILMAYFYARKDYAILPELNSGKGYADVVLVPQSPRNRPAIIIELKCGGAPEVALRQIRERDYSDRLRSFRGGIVCVGVAYDPVSKTHSCAIERNYSLQV